MERDVGRRRVVAGVLAADGERHIFFFFFFFSFRGVGGNKGKNVPSVAVDLEGPAALDARVAKVGASPA